MPPLPPWRWTHHLQHQTEDYPRPQDTPDAIGLFLPVIRVRSTIDTTASKYRPNAVEAAVVGAVHR
jgi:hypothetical protein